MSYFDDASLVMIPSGYKDQKVYSVKPLDGSGDLDFTRASDATRVASNGLIEKVRTNLILQSEAFNTTWGPNLVSVTANTTANPLNGALTADTITLGAGTAAKFLYQSVTSFNGLITHSLYLKAGTHQFVQLLSGEPTVRANFDLVNGTASAISSTAQIISLGDGWFRCSISYTATISPTVVYIWAVDSLGAARAASTASTGTFIAFGYQNETGDIATDYIATTSAAVSVGPVSGLPRLDYLNSSCPRLLLEPQRTNALLFSEQFDNAAWNKVQCSITANQMASPSGYQDADLIVENTANSSHSFNNSLGITSTAGVHTASAFFKKNTKNFGFIQIATDGAANRYTAVFDLVNGTVTSTTTMGSPTSTSNSIVDYGNGWYRVSVSAQHTSSTLFIILGLSNSATPTYNITGYPTYIGNGTDSIATWGAQIELGAYATSYIPTYGTSVTRVVDTFISGDISSYIGNSEFVLFAEFSLNNKSADFNQFGLSDGTSDNMVYFNKRTTDNTIAFLYENNNVTQFREVSVSDLSANNKFALRYTSGVMSSFANGTKAADVTGLSDISSTLDQLQTGRGTYNGNFFEGSIKQLIIFPTALTDAQCIELTA